MSLICACPPAAEIADIPTATCLEDFGQIQKVIFQRIYETGTTKNKIDGGDDPALLATWTALKAASDSTKVTVSPFIQEPTSEAGAKREYGGGNATLGGVPITLGSEPTSFTAKILRTKQDVIEALKGYMCENIGVFLVNSRGQIAALVDDVTTPTEYMPFPVQGFFVSDKNFGGYEEVDSNNIEWMFPENWSDKFYVITPTDFVANTDL
jgi:hypothetical protein